MKVVAATDLSNVVGGASSKLDQQTELALTKLSSDLKDLSRPQQNNTNQQMTMLMAAAVMSRFR